MYLTSKKKKSDHTYTLICNEKIRCAAEYLHSQVVLALNALSCRRTSFIVGNKAVSGPFIIEGTRRNKQKAATSFLPDSSVHLVPTHFQSGKTRPFTIRCR